MGERFLNKFGNLHDPKASAEDFARFAEVSITYHPGFREQNIFFLNLEPGRKTPEYQDRLEERGNEILSRARITPQFRHYIISQLLIQFKLGLSPGLEYNLKEYAGVDLDKGEYGIFDPKKAKGLEEEFLKKIIADKDELSAMAAIDIAGINLDEWEKSFRDLHREKPI